MPKEYIKSRWKPWESNCVKKAFEEQIQHKIVAIALRRSMNAVSKRIKRLGLRKATFLPGRIKGKRAVIPWVQKTQEDFTKMTEILNIYAPLEAFQQGQWALKERCWAVAKALNNLIPGASIDSICKENASFSISKVGTYTYASQPLSKKSKKQKKRQQPIYRVLSHIEEWAVSEGFHYVKEGLQQHAYLFWKDGKLFSKAQLLIYIHQKRLETKLFPLNLQKKEKK